MAEPLRVLVVDDERSYAEMVIEFLRSSDAWWISICDARSGSNSFNRNPTCSAAERQP